VTRGPRRPGADPVSVDLEQLWFAMLRRRAWSSLAVVPADAGASARAAAATVARGLAAVGERHLGRRVTLIVTGEVAAMDAMLSGHTSPPIAALPAEELEPVLVPSPGRIALPEAVETRIARIVSRDWRLPFAHHHDLGGLAETPPAPAPVIVSLEPVVSNPLGIAVALAADAALLCITLGETLLASAKRTVDLIGPERFIGSVVLRA
jgi:hypothetical protein